LGVHVTILIPDGAVQVVSGTWSQTVDGDDAVLVSVAGHEVGIVGNCLNAWCGSGHGDGVWSDSQTTEVAPLIHSSTDLDLVLVERDSIWVLGVVDQVGPLGGNVVVD